MPNFKWAKWKQDYDAIAKEIGITHIPIFDFLQPPIKQYARTAFEASGYYSNPNMLNGNFLGSEGTFFCMAPRNLTDNPYLLNRTSPSHRYVEDYAGNTPFPKLVVLSEMRADYADLRGWRNVVHGGLPICTGEKCTSRNIVVNSFLAWVRKVTPDLQECKILF